MLNMKAFRKLLAASSEAQDPRTKALIALTKVSPAQLVAMTDGLDWQAW
ncbi:MAG: hypothetical protein HZB19_17785 [Chloroflexi bacterium]|nr:hypothetical protein [Chloroflexota bacterium]